MGNRDRESWSGALPLDKFPLKLLSNLVWDRGVRIGVTGVQVGKWGPCSRFNCFKPIFWVTPNYMLLVTAYERLMKPLPPIKYHFCMLRGEWVRETREKVTKLGSSWDLGSGHGSSSLCSPCRVWLDGSGAVGTMLWTKHAAREALCGGAGVQCSHSLPSTPQHFSRHFIPDKGCGSLRPFLWTLELLSHCRFSPRLFQFPIPILSQLQHAKHRELMLTWLSLQGGAQDVVLGGTLSDRRLSISPPLSQLHYYFYFFNF